MAGRRTVKFVLIVVAALTLGGAAPPEADRQGDAPTALGRAVAHWQMGYTFHLLGQYTAAVRFFRKSIEIHPTARGHLPPLLRVIVLILHENIVVRLF